MTNVRRNKPICFIFNRPFIMHLAFAEINCYNKKGFFV